MRRLGAFGWLSLGAGLTFLYAPIALVVIYSFNESRLVTVWSGFSTRWYASLWSNDALLRAATNSLGVAAVAATLATILGALAALALTRRGARPAFSLLAAMTYSPLVMPEVITGLSLLLLFVAMGLDRGFWTVAAAHVTFTMSFVTVVVQARLLTLDRALEEAALDLGATPVATFFQITLPLIAPALAGAWMLAFTLSLDDLVLASFTSGPGATTLPMHIFGQARRGVSPEINAVSAILIAIVATGAITFALIARWRASAA